MATLGTLEYLISVNSSGVKSGIDKAEREVKSSGDRVGRQLDNVGTKISAWTIAKGQMIAHFAERAIQTTANMVKQTVKSAVDAYAQYEQLVGGVETLYGDAADTVVKNASKAFKTAGVSANQYMEQVTSFAASLKQSLGGDVAKAAEIADMAIIDIADNSNKMGTAMESIQHAYQGFAKQNYTMLDNLKLGYGGTKTEMERLLADAEKLSGVKYDIKNLSDVYEAIHVIQTELGITGTTKAEAEGTISGAMNSAKAAWQDLLVALGSGKDVKKATTNFGRTLATTVKNIRPVALNAIHGIFESAKVLFPELKALFKETFTAVKLQVADWLDLGSDASWIDIGIKLAGKIKSGAKSSLIDWLELGDDASWIEIGSSALEKVKKGAKTRLIDLFGLADSSGNKLGDDATWGDVGTSIAEKFSESLSDGGWLNEALTNAAENLTALTDIASKFIIGIAEWISKPESVQTVVSIITNLINAIGDAAEPIINAITKIITDPKLWAALETALGTILKAVGKAILGDEAYKFIFGEEEKPFDKTMGNVDKKYDMKELPDAGFFTDKQKRDWGAVWESAGMTGMLPMWAEERSLADELVNVRNKAIDEQNQYLYEKAAAGIRAFADAWNEGIRGKDNLTEIVQEAVDAVEPPEVDVKVKPEDGSKSKLEKDISPLNATVHLEVDDSGLSLSFGGFHQAKGDWNVPYDNYPSLLHRGEMVLTASQARRYREGEMNADYGIIGEMIGTAINQSMKKVYVMMSGEKVGDLTTKRVRRNINASSYSKTRAMGG